MENSTDNREEGVIKMISLEKGFGFIRRDAQTDLFFHITECGDGDEDYKSVFESLERGTKVTFGTGDGNKGLEARNVILCQN
jgi:cold shock protein